MAEFNIYRLRLLGPVDGTYQSGYIVYIKWDDVAENIKVDLHDNLDVYVSSPLSGPDLTVVDYVETDYRYQFCDSSTLITFSRKYTSYPYATRNESPDHDLCSLSHICDILITDISTTNATSTTSTDGEATITVVGDSSTYTYSLDKDFYTTQPSNVFTGLPAGDYVVYVRDKYGCSTLRSFTIGFDSTYNVRFRSEFESILYPKLMFDYRYRIDILKRDYVGSIETVKTSRSPIIVKYEGDNEDKFKTIISSRATVSLKAESEYQFSEIFTGDEREFIVCLYIDKGEGYELEWKGYVIQEGTQEDYSAPPYDFSIMATDGIVDIKEPFNGGTTIKGTMSLIKILSRCLYSTDLNFNIRSFINRFEVNHDQEESDDPLAQTFFNTYFLNEYTNIQVVDEILKTFGARIYQSRGVWNVISIEDSVSESIPYREFDSLGTYVTNGTLNLQKHIKFPDQSNALWFSSRPLLRIRPGYKRVKIVHDLNLINNLFFEGRFDEDDFNTTTNLFDNIGMSLDGSGIYFGISKNTKDQEVKESLFLDFSNADLLSTASIYTNEKEIDSIPGSDVFKFAFDYYIDSLFYPEYIRFDWSLQLGTGYLQGNSSFNPSSLRVFNTLYNENFDSNEKFEITFKAPYVFSGNTKISIALKANHPYDASTVSALGTFDVSPSTTSYLIGDRRIALDDVDGVLVKRHYVLTYQPQDENLPEVVHPNDYNSSTNPRVWILEKTTQFEALAPQASFYEIDNLRLEYYPDGLPPESVKVYTLTGSLRNKIEPEIPVIFGDLPDFRNAIHLYKNYLMLSDGTPTSAWGRATTSEELPILEILCFDYIGQYPLGLRQLGANLVGDFVFNYQDCLVDDIDGTKYINMGLEIDYKNNLYTCDLTEVKSGESGPPSDTSGFTTGFSLGFRA